ncbi:MAG: hypothetical protein ACD_79C01310G0001 [uncultured bacterium]|nr:MAG: hypothetical protein ACD_79C01310G0001 [uncultured bacterium]
MLNKSLFNYLSLQNSKSLLQLSSPFISIIIYFRDENYPPDKEQFKLQLISLLSSFEIQLKNLQHEKETIFSAIYCLCTALDEFISLSHWGKTLFWAQDPLLEKIHHESGGGEGFFLILSDLLISPEKNIELLEVIYLLLNLGYEGKYYNSNKDGIVKIKEEIFVLIEGKYHFKKNPENIALKKKTIPGSFKKFYFYRLFVFFITLLILSNTINFIYSKQIFEKLQILSYSNE